MVPIFDRFEGIERPALLGKDDLGGLGPNEGFGVGVVVVEVVVDRLCKLGHAGEDAAADALFGDLGEEAL
mgnify:CR=1 FL=1